jgi:hypothetical protein
MERMKDLSSLAHDKPQGLSRHNSASSSRQRITRFQQRSCQIRQQ